MRRMQRSEEEVMVMIWLSRLSFISCWLLASQW